MLRAYWSRFGRYSSSTAVAGYGTEGWAVIFPFVAFPSATQSHRTSKPRTSSTRSRKSSVLGLPSKAP